MAFTVMAVDQNGRGIEGLRVMLRFVEPTRGDAPAEDTNEDGCAEFDGFDQGEVQVFVDGTDCGVHDYEDGELVKITR
jgi:hypothetical protein